MCKTCHNRNVSYMKGCRRMGLSHLWPWQQVLTGAYVQARFVWLRHKFRGILMWQRHGYTAQSPNPSPKGSAPLQLHSTAQGKQSSVQRLSAGTGPHKIPKKNEIWVCLLTTKYAYLFSNGPGKPEDIAVHHLRGHVLCVALSPYLIYIRLTAALVHQQMVQEQLIARGVDGLILKQNQLQILWIRQNQLQILWIQQNQLQILWIQQNQLQILWIQQNQLQILWIPSNLKLGFIWYLPDFSSSLKVEKACNR